MSWNDSSNIFTTLFAIDSGASRFHWRAAARFACHFDTEGDIRMQAGFSRGNPGTLGTVSLPPFLDRVVAGKI